MATPRSPEVLRFWQAFAATLPLEDRPSGFDVWPFGDSAEMSAELLGLVRSGIKRGTAGLWWDALTDSDAQPKVGGYSVVTEWDGTPALVLRSLATELRPHCEVTEAFAASEGEGDRSLNHWREAHWAWAVRRCEQIGRVPSEQMLWLCERFKVVWPPEIADRD